MPNTRIWWDTGVKAYRVSTPYNQGFVDTIKRLMPYSDRSWDASSKIWTITERFFGPVKDLCETVWPGSVTVVTRQQAEAAQQPKSMKNEPVDITICQFFKLLPFESAQKAYRDAAMRCHPDKGGDMETMSKLNAAWQRLEQEFYKK